MKRLSIIPAIAILISCQGTTKKEVVKSEKDTLTEVHQIGGEKDKHGCLTSAGYTWSEIRRDCIRLFEAGIRINPLNNSEEYVSSGFLIFDNDSSSVELFLPSMTGSEILSRKNNIYESSDQKYKLSQTDSTWTLNKDNKMIYTSK